MKRTIILLFGLIYCFNEIHAINPKSVSHIIIDYLIKKRDLPENKHENDLANRVLIYDLFTNKEAGKKTEGVFRFRMLSDHSKSYIIIAESSQYKILKLEHLDKDLLDIISYAKRAKLSSAIILVYVRNAILLYQWNQNVVPWKD